jgi:hypothetical protein
MSLRFGIPLVVLALLVLALLYFSFLGGPGSRASVSFAPLGSGTDAAVAGRVLDPKGAPVGGVTVVWHAEEGGNTGMFAVRPFSSREEVISAVDGSFRFDGVPIAEGFAAVRGPESGYEGSSASLLPRTGHVAEGLKVTVKPIAPERWVTGTLIGSDGKALAHARIRAEASSFGRNWSAQFTTDEAGHFTTLAPWPRARAQLTWLPDGAGPVPLGTIRGGEPAQLTATPP